MIINEDISDAAYQINAYTHGSITVNQQQYSRSLIIGTNTLISDWAPQSLPELAPKDWEPILLLKPEIILLGTGQHFILLPPALLTKIYAANIGIESMDTAAACRTYMALIAEHRNVIAALLIH